MDRTFRRLAVLSLCAGLAVPAAGEQSVLQTWHPWQLDSVLVAWALTQARSPAPVFESITRGAPITPERGIDTPDSPYRRTGHRTAFEEAVRLNKVNHPCVARLRDAVRVVELAAWRKPEFPGVEEFEARVLKVIPHRPARGGLEAALAEVDRYCKEAKQ
jgi:hypothetical protein